MKIGVLFPGYGSQFIGMAKELYDESRVVQEYFEEASSCLDVNFVKLCFASSDTELARMDNAYASIFLVSSALFALLKERNVKPYLIAGYNQGEFAAIHAAGGFTFPDGLYLLSKYSSLYAEMLTSVDANGIRVSGLSFEQIHDACQKITKPGRWVHVALQNLPTEHVVMGSPEAIERVRERVMEQPEVEIYDADVELGLHAMSMEPVVNNLKIYSEKVDFKDLTVPMVSNARAQAIMQAADVKSALIEQLQSMVRWSECLQKLGECDLLVEVGPGTLLTTMVKKVYPDKHCMAINTQEDIDTLERLVASPQE